MHSHRERKVKLSLVLADAATAAGSLLAASVVHGGGVLERWFDLGPAPPLADFYPAAAAAALTAPLMLDRYGAYRPDRRQSWSRASGALIKGVLASALALLGLGLAFSLESLTWVVVGPYAAIQLGALGAERAAALAVLRRLWRGAYKERSFVVIGSRSRAQRVAERIVATPGWRMRHLGFLDDEPRQRDVQALGDRYLGKTKELGNLLQREVVDEVVIALSRKYVASDSTAEAVAVCEAVGVDVTISTDLFDTRRASVQLHQLLGVPAITISSYQRRPLWALAVKRAIDLAGGAVGTLFLLFILPAVALAIKLESPGPVLYVQRRCGLNGRIFPFFKFRTMYRDAEARIEELREHNEVSGPVFKMKNDPRVTRVGRFLRRSSIDEMPQFLNVLLGHMSLVGPRPPIPGEVDQYELRQRRRLSVKPGLTCLWQVRGRSLIRFEDWVQLDLEYIDRWSLLLDARILLSTIPAVLSTRGAS